MTQDDAKLVCQVLAPLRERPLPVTDAEHLDSRREQLLPALRDAVRKVPVRRTERRWRTIVAIALPAAAAGALVVGAAGVHWQASAEPISELQTEATLRVSASAGEVTYRADDSTRTLAVGHVADFPARGRLATGTGAEARIEAQGLEVTLREHTEVGVPDEGLRSLRIAQGGVRCVVPPLGPNRQFSVITPDATVVVHGTVFSVSFDAETKQSCVSVEEGVVSVRHAAGKTWLEAGDSWGCATTAPAADEPPPTAPRSTPPARPGTLGQENALFESALAAKVQGNPDAARAKLQELLQKYPQSPLAPEARAMLNSLQGQ